jgi:phage terminase large subunit
MVQVNLNSLHLPKLLETTKRYVLLYGGRARGGSHAMSQRVVHDTKHNDYSRAAIMRYILGDIRDSVWTDFKDRLEDFEMPEVTSDQVMKYEYRNNLVQAKGFKKSTSQNTAKLKSLANFNLIGIEEAEEVEDLDFDQLDSSIRTDKALNQIIMSFNMPHKDHWIIRRWFNLEPAEVEGYYKVIPKDRDDTEYIFGTYHDNVVNLTPSVIRTYEQFKETNPEYYYTMIKGYVSEGVKGRVFKDWKTITDQEYDELPYNSYYGLDFGFTNDPTALIEFKHHNKNVWVKELIYDTQLTNEDIANRMQELNVSGKIIADSAEPKSIEEIKRHKFKIFPSVKGADSIRSGITLLNEYTVHYTESSQNIAREVQNYVYALDRDKQPTNKPIDDYNHAMDAIRYIAQDRLKKKRKVELTWI